MKQLSSRALSVALPLLGALTVTLVLILSKKPLLQEVFMASLILTGAYTLFVWLCLWQNWGIKKERPLGFQDIPGLTKVRNLFRHTDTAAPSVDLDLGDDLLGALMLLVLQIVLPIIITVVLFLASGGVEALVFAVLLLSYIFVIRILRGHLTLRRKVQGRPWVSLGFGILLSLSSFGLVSLGLGLALWFTR